GTLLYVHSAFALVNYGIAPYDIYKLVQCVVTGIIVEQVVGRLVSWRPFSNGTGGVQPSTPTLQFGHYGIAVGLHQNL
ncbi:hypothetical protein ACJX0J_006474, partial [Zea mays]